MSPEKEGELFGKLRASVEGGDSEEHPDEKELDEMGQLEDPKNRNVLEESTEHYDFNPPVQIESTEKTKKQSENYPHHKKTP